MTVSSDGQGVKFKTMLENFGLTPHCLRPAELAPMWWNW
jgi:hypothetical protein